jgi:hypothetical protein
MSISPDAAAVAEPAAGAASGPSVTLRPKDAATINKVKNAEIIAFICLIAVSI